MDSVIDALRHNPFTAVGLLVTITTLIVFQWWRQRKVFSYIVMSDYSIFGIDKTFGDRVKILFDGKPVGRVSLIVIEFRNSGWVPIEDKDFFKPIEVIFDEKSEIMNIEVDETRPKDMGISTVNMGSKLVVEPNLFNRRDFVRLKILVHGYKGHISVKGRIKGVPEIKRGNSTFSPAVKLFMFSLWATMIYPIYKTLESVSTDKITPAISTALIFIFICLFMALLIRNDRPLRLRIYDD